MNIGKRNNRVIENMVQEFYYNFNLDFDKIMNDRFHKIVPASKRLMENYTPNSQFFRNN